MSAEFDVSGDGLSQANNVVSTDDYVAMCWVRITDGSFSNPDYQTIFLRANNVYDQFAGVWVYEDGTGLFFEFDARNNLAVDGSIIDNTQYITLNQWYHVAYTKRGSTHRLYINGILIGNVVLNISGVTFADLFAGYDGFSEPGVEIQAFREWNAAIATLPLEADAIISEMNSPTDAVVTAALVTNTPLTSDLLDISGNSNDWTAVGSVAFVTDPPYPANSIASGAIDLGTIPDTVTQNLLSGGIVWDAWYFYTANADKEIGVWGFGDLTNFSPTVTVWSPDAVTPYVSVSFPIVATNVPIQVPVENGVTYFFRFRTNSQGLAAPILTIDTLNHTSLGIVIGSICVNDDAEGFPLAILSPDVDYLVNQFIQPFGSGEAGDVLDNGVVLVTNVDTQEYIGYDATYIEIFRSAGGVVVLTTVGGTIRQCRGTQRFWIGLFTGGTNDSVCYIEDDGTVGPTHIIGAHATVRVRAIAANNDETILYYAVEAGAHLGKIRSYNLLTDTIIGDFAAAIAGYGIGDILILSDDSIVAVYSNSSTKDVKVLRYNAAGTILNTYEFGTDHNFPSGSIARIAYSLDDPDTFWIYEQLFSEIGVSKFSEINISDGSTVRSVNHRIYEEGAYLGDVVDDPVRFGHSFSCPFWVATQGVAPPTTGTLTVAKLSDPFSGLHEFFVDVLSGLSPALLTLVSDDAGHTYDPVPVGIYSVVEQPDPDWFAVYFVSNDVNNDNLHVSVGAGENVTVIVLNTAQTPGGGTYSVTPDSGKPNDDFINGDGSITRRGIPPPFIITGFIRDA